MFHKIIGVAAAALIASAAGAQTPQAGSHNPVVKNSAPHAVASPATGANSFTRGQARGRFARAGFAGIGNLTKTNGIWQASATKGGRHMTVMLDYKGNITTR